MASITCRAKGTNAHTHNSIEAVRKHFTVETFPCPDLVDTREHDEDGQRIILPCNGLSWDIDGGTRCEHGHEYIDAQTRHEQGWDYAEDGEEARRLARAGVKPRPMGPNTYLDTSDGGDLAYAW
jgi:hypothetical protein